MMMMSIIASAKRLTIKSLCVVTEYRLHDVGDVNGDCQMTGCECSLIRQLSLYEQYDLGRRNQRDVRHDDRSEHRGDALVGVNMGVSDVELATQVRRSSHGLHQSAVCDRQHCQRYEDAKYTVEPDVDAH